MAFCHVMSNDRGSYKTVPENIMVYQNIWKNLGDVSLFGILIYRLIGG